MKSRKSYGTFAKYPGLVYDIADTNPCQTQNCCICGCSFTTFTSALSGTGQKSSEKLLCVYFLCNIHTQFVTIKIKKKNQVKISNVCISFVQHSHPICHEQDTNQVKKILCILCFHNCHIWFIMNWLKIKRKTALHLFFNSFISFLLIGPMTLLQLWSPFN